MDKIILRKNSSRTIRLVASLAATLAVIICSIKIAMAIQYNAITVANTNGNITVNGNTIDGLNITPAIIFNNTGDSITYQVILSNPDHRSFQITNISDDNANSFITTSYDYSKEMDGAEKPILITLAYSAYLPFGDELNLQDIHINIDINEEDPAEKPDPTAAPATPVPSTTPSPSSPTTPSSSSSSHTTSNPATSNTKSRTIAQGTTANATSSSNVTSSSNIASSSSATLTIPNTGSANTSKYLSSNFLLEDQFLPTIIIYIVAIAILVTVIPKKSRIHLSRIAVFAIMLILGGTVSQVYAASSELQLTIIGSSISALPDLSDPKEVVSITFPNIYNNKVQDRDGQAPGNAIILKTMDDKYVLMDTGPSTDNIREVIYNALKELQGSEQVTLDYLIISHLDHDHYGNATAFLNDENYHIKNVALKHERDKDTVFKRIAQAAADNEVNLLTSDGPATEEYLASTGVESYDKIEEGMVLEVGKYLKLNFFNTTDVYADKECPTGYILNWTASTSTSDYIKTANDEYIYIDGSEYVTKQDGEFSLSSSRYPYADVPFHTTPALVTKEGGSSMNRYFYAVKGSSHNICRSNPNSFGILAEVTTTDLKRYMYFAGDIENAGYGRLSSGANSAALYSEDYESIIFEDGEFQNNITPYAIPSEDDTATAIYDKLAADATALELPVETLLDNIVVYQESHHGGNNSEKAVWKLNLNRDSGIYAVQEGSTNMATTVDFNAAKTYWYTLGALPAENKIRVGDNSKDGANCTINMIGETVCIQY